MEVINLFPTRIAFWKDCNFDLADLEKKCRLFQKKTPNSNHSNVNGYQGHGFMYPDLIEFIKKNIPTHKTKKITTFKFYAWVNINGYGHFNKIHNHNPHHGNMLSGVLYVKTPKNCGKIKFYDPRPNIDTAPDMEYYEDMNNQYEITVKPNLLLLFPAWLQHDVGINESNEERISISFNIFEVEYK